MLGAEVTAVDSDPAKLAMGREAAKSLGLSVSWMEWDLDQDLPLGTFDVLLVFNYLDRVRLPQWLNLLRPGGLLLMETFLREQRDFEWGPTKDDHLLKRGELSHLITPALTVIHAREVLEPVGGVRWSAIASVVAKKVA
jgi:tellurite methyltransferase